MDLTSKQRAQLRGLANDIDTILHIGKDGIGDNLVKQADDALEARELIKGKVLENSMLSAREGAEELAKATRSQVVQVIGTKFVLYRETHSKEKDKRIKLVKCPGPQTPSGGRPGCAAVGFCLAKPYAQAEFISAEQDETGSPWSLLRGGNGSLEQSSYSIARPMARKKISGSSW